MKRGKSPGLSRREREIMDVVYEFGSASAQDVRDQMSDPPTYTAIRTLLTILEEKGHLRHRMDGTRYIYEPVVPRDEMGRTAISGVLRTFFEGSVEKAVSTLLTTQDSALSSEELERISEMIEQAKRDGR